MTSSSHKTIHFLLLVLIAFAIIAVYLWFDTADSAAVMNFRLPRLLLAFVAGFVLAGVGSTYQALLNNPLAEPYILGTSAGAALGSTIGIIMNLWWLVPVFGFIGALASMAIVWFLARGSGLLDKNRLLLSGIVTGMFFSALISLLMYLNQQKLGSIINILLGNLEPVFTASEWYFFLGVSGISLLLMLYLFMQANHLTALTSGDLIATSLGLDVRKIRIRLYIVCSILTGIVVSYAGIIGFVGLIVPHMTRMLFGVNQRRNMITASFLGAILLILCDFIAKHVGKIIYSGVAIEIPVGVITSFFGAPFFLWIMSRSSKN